MSEFIPTLRSQPLATRLAQIDEALDILAQQTQSYVVIGGITYTNARIKDLQELRHATERQYRRALTHEGKPARRIEIRM